MKGMKSLFLLGTALAVMSSSALADATGTQTFKANVTADTCTIANLQQNFDLGALRVGQFTGHWSNDTEHEIDFNVASCPTTTTKVKVTPAFTTISAYDFIVKNSGTAVGVNLNLDGLLNSSDSNRIWKNGKAKEFTLNNGAVTVPVYFRAQQNGDDAVISGTLDFQMTFAFEFI
ncbi:type 1 fimbrial protein [Salmonella enterica]|nr:type 1 fimbrial protein [Salmonella enterica]EIE7706321.1 type 1 fimbrial protein [Salmonella enterica]EIN2108690.1 type 1 fimbrial protein [Salmonella enterica]EIO8765278.1 type 1 fimbrial protein [Salmonella enterica]